MAMESISLSVDLLRDRASGVHLQEVNVLVKLCSWVFLKDEFFNWKLFSNKPNLRHFVPIMFGLVQQNADKAEKVKKGRESCELLERSLRRLFNIWSN